MKITVRHNNTEIIYEDAQLEKYPQMTNSDKSFNNLLATIEKMAEQVVRMSPTAYELNKDCVIITNNLSEDTTSSASESD